jgi:hypothetical protein
VILEEALKKIDPSKQREFLHFVQTGEAKEEFLTYLDNDNEAQQAVEMTFNAQAEAFQGLAEELKSSPPSSISLLSVEPVSVASERMAEAVGVVLQLPVEERAEAVRQTVSALRTSLGPDQQGSVQSVVRSLEHEMSSAAWHG